MSGAPQITVQFDLCDAAALPAVLRGRIDDVERHLALRADALTAQDQAMSRRYVRQLARCALAIEEQLPGREGRR